MEDHILIRVIADELRANQKKPQTPKNIQEAQRIEKILDDLLAS